MTGTASPLRRVIRTPAALVSADARTRGATAFAAELHRAYLDHGHIVLGIRWHRYGWVVPGQAVSGLEDEDPLSGNRPKLIYVKPTGGREPIDSVIDEALAASPTG